MQVDEITVSGVRVESGLDATTISSPRNNDIDEPNWIILDHDEVHAMIFALRAIGFSFDQPKGTPND